MKTILLSAFVLLSLTTFAQAEKITTAIEKIKPFEKAYLEYASLMSTTTVKRFYRTSGTTTELFRSEPVYTEKALQDSSFMLLVAYWEGEKENFYMNYTYAFGNSIAVSGSLFVSGNEKIQSEKYSGPSTGEVRVIRNKKVIYKKPTTE